MPSQSSDPIPALSSSDTHTCDHLSTRWPQGVIACFQLSWPEGWMSGWGMIVHSECFTAKSMERINRQGSLRLRHVDNRPWRGPTCWQDALLATSHTRCQQFMFCPGTGGHLQQLFSLPLGHRLLGEALATIQTPSECSLASWLHL